MYLERLLGPSLRKGSETAPVVMLTGARQVGKTTLLRHLEPERRFVTLDDMDARRLAREEPKLFLERFPPPVLIDEFQYAPGILPYIKIWVDERRTRLKPADGAFWLTGSQQFASMKGVTESLAGRVFIYELHGLGLSEARPEKSPPKKPFFEREDWAFEAPARSLELFELILRGDKPEVWTRPGTERGRYYSSYVQTYLERDVRGQLAVRDLEVFDRFLRLLAGRVGQLLNMSPLASDLGISVPTVKEWLAVLQRSFQILLLEPYFRNSRKRLVRTPKLYFMDTGLAAHLLKWTEPDTTLAGPMAGPLFENWVVSEIVKSYRHRGQDPRLYFWRSRDGREYDVVREAGGALDVAEIKLGASAHRHFDPLARGLKSLREPVRGFRLICLADRNWRRSEGGVVSAWSLG